MLQPVQMVHLPNGQSTFVVANTNTSHNNNHNNNGGGGDVRGGNSNPGPLLDSHPLHGSNRNHLHLNGGDSSHSNKNFHISNGNNNMNPSYNHNGSYENHNDVKNHHRSIHGGGNNNSNNNNRLSASPSMMSNHGSHPHNHNNGNNSHHYHNTNTNNVNVTSKKKDKRNKNKTHNGNKQQQQLGQGGNNPTSSSFSNNSNLNHSHTGPYSANGNSANNSNSSNNISSSKNSNSTNSSDLNLVGGPNNFNLNHPSGLYAKPNDAPSNANDNNSSSPSASSDTITALYHSTHRPPLSSLLGHVRRLSRDQVGCRLLQQSLDEDGPHAATAILNEGLPFLTEAMTDPFGNYLFQKILEKITPDERLLLVTTVAPRLVNAALNLHGTRSVQKVVEMSALDDSCRSDKKHKNSSGEESVSFTNQNNPNILLNANVNVAEIVTRALAPAAARLCIDSHGNHVIQRILQKLPHHHSKFVFDAVAHSVGDVARHRHGCCVIQRCLDSPLSAARSNLVKRIVEKSLDLMQDAYGNYVVQYVLDVCGDEEAGAVCESVVGKMALLAIQKFSSNVMEKCLERSNDRIRELHLHELSSPDKIRELMVDPFGNYVVQKALSVATHAQAVGLVEAMRPHLPGMRNTAGGRRIVAKISRRFPRFDPNANVGIDVFSQSQTTATNSTTATNGNNSTMSPTNMNMNHNMSNGNGSNNGNNSKSHTSGGVNVDHPGASFSVHHSHHVNYPHQIPVNVNYINTPSDRVGPGPGPGLAATTTSPSYH